MELFGLRLQEARKRNKLSVQELSERSGVPVATIYRMEGDKNNKPRLDIAVQLAKTLCVSLDWMTGVWERERWKGDGPIQSAD